MFAFISAIAQVGGVFIDKVVLTRRQVEVRIYLSVLTLFLTVFTAFLFPFLGSVSSDALKPFFLVLFLGMMICAIIWNILYHTGFKAEKVQEYELIIMFQPLVTILLAAAIYPSERNLHIFIAALIASLALIITHIPKKHLEFSRGAWQLIAAVIFMSVEHIIFKELLTVYSPVALYLFRTTIMFIFFYFYFKPWFKKIAPMNYILIGSSALLGVMQMVAKLYGFQSYGVVYTALILIIAPILIYLFSNVLLHERLRLRSVISFAIILGCIIYATVYGQ